MKGFFYILFIYLILCCNLFAQSFFPLNIGNKYQYEYNQYYYHSGNLISHIVTYPKVIVTEDTIVNGKIFYQFNGNYYNFEEPEQKLYILYSDSIELAVDFNLPLDSTQLMYFGGVARNWKSKGQYSEIIFGESKTIFEMRYSNSGSSPGHVWQYIRTLWFAEDIGLIESYYSEYDDYGFYQTDDIDHKELFTAIVDSTVFNQHILDILVLTPLENRPINHFPFNLRVGLNITNIALLDTMYTEVLVYREDSLLVAHNFYSIGTITLQSIISLDSTILEVDDLIKLRCYASDITIFENTATDPDSGFYEFVVLPALTSVTSTESAINTFALKQNYPNPFNPVTTISYQIPERGIVTIKVYDVLGNEVATLVSEEKPVGSYKVEWNAVNLPSGIYFYRMRAGNFVETKKLILLK
jgi:hypothetical protein